MSPATAVVEQRLQREQRLGRRLEQRVRRIDVHEFDPVRPDGCDRGRHRSSSATGRRSGFDLQAVLVVPKRDGNVCRRRVDGSDRDHAMGRAVDRTEHAAPVQIDRVQHTVEDEISDVAVAPRRPGHGPVEEIVVLPYPTSRLAQRSGGVGREPRRPTSDRRTAGGDRPWRRPRSAGRRRRTRSVGARVVRPGCARG